MNNNELKSNLLSAKHWIRLVFMLLFGVILQVAATVMSVLVVVQFLFALVTGNSNPALRKFGSSLSKFIYQTFEFLTYNSEDKPFPFSDWPEADEVKDPEVASTSAAKPATETPEPAPKPEKLETVEAEEAEDFVKQEDA